MNLLKKAVSDEWPLNVWKYSWIPWKKTFFGYCCCWFLISPIATLLTTILVVTFLWQVVIKGRLQKYLNRKPVLGILCIFSGWIFFNYLHYYTTDTLSYSSFLFAFKSVFYFFILLFCSWIYNIIINICSYVALLIQSFFNVCFMLTSSCLQQQWALLIVKVRLH